MEVPTCVPCWNGPSRRWLSVGACLFGHFGRQADDGSDDLVDLAEQVCELRVALAKLAATVLWRSGAPVPVLEADAKGIPKRGLDTHEVAAEEQEFQECITEEIIDVMTASNTMQSGGHQESSRLMSTTTTSSVSVNGEFDTRVHHRSEVKESERTEPVAPIPEFQEETVEVIQLSPQKHKSVLERMHEQTVDAAVPQILEEPVAPIPEFQEETVEVIELSTQERKLVPKRMQEQTVDATVPQMVEEPVAPIPEFQEETVEVIQLSPQERVSVHEAWPPWFESDLAESSDEESSEEAKRPRHWSRRHWGRRQGARDGWSWAENSWSWRW